jgi:hypothetical protein
MEIGENSRNQQKGEQKMAKSITVKCMGETKFVKVKDYNALVDQHNYLIRKIAELNPCKHTGMESFICEVCKYPWLPLEYADESND